MVSVHLHLESRTKELESDEFPHCRDGPLRSGVSRLLSRRRGGKGAVLRDQQLGEGNVETMEAETRLKSGWRCRKVVRCGLVGMMP